MPRSERAQPRRRAQRGFSLAEAVISLAIVSLVLGSLSSLVVISTRSLAVLAAETQADRAEEALFDLAADLRFATSLPERSATAVTAIVPDRDGDGQPETIRYSWAGPGHPLLRTVNGEQETLVEDVRSLNLTYVLGAGS